MQLMKLKNFLSNSLITSKIENISVCTNQPKAKEIFFYFQCLIARCTKQTENKREAIWETILREQEQTNFTQWHKQSDLISTKVSQNQERVSKAPMDCVI